MSETTQLYRKRLDTGVRRALVLGDSAAPVFAMIDALVIVILSVAAGVIYHLHGYGEVGVVQNYVRVGLLTALFYVAPRSLQKQYDLSKIISDPAAIRHIFKVWNIALFCVLAVAFVAKLTDDYSRGAAILFYFSGLFALSLQRAATVAFVQLGFRKGWLASKRLLLLGTQDRIRDFRDLLLVRDYGLRIIDIEELPNRSKGEAKSDFRTRLDRTLNRTVLKARTLGIDNVILLLPWSNTSILTACREALLTIPAVTVLGPEKAIGRALDRGVSWVGPISGLKLVRAPLNLGETFAKRLLDIMIATIALVALAPFLALIALIIKLDTGGPVLFRQFRHGFNQKPFRILKFRTMTVAEDEGGFTQATRDDPRITAFGRFLRSWNIDELPQVINVLRGEMSIVGPRPHALVHNEEFQNRIALYARRHNVKPGITGWAQVNGYRGQTDTELKMRGRVDHDLYYIDNWSIWFDLQIILMTLFSRRAFQNAY